MKDSMMEKLAKSVEQLLSKVTNRVQRLEEDDESKENNYRLAKVDERLGRQVEDNRDYSIIITGWTDFTTKTCWQQ